MRTLSLALIGLIAVSGANAAQDRFKSLWSESCQNGSSPFSIEFRSRSGDATEDDMTVTLQWGSNAPIVIPVAPALFIGADFATDARNLCKSIGAFSLPSGRVLLLLPRDDRPSEDVLVAVVVNELNGSVVQVIGDIGSYSNEVMVLRRQNGFRLLLLREGSFDNIGVGGGEFSAPDWKILQERNGRVSSQWEVKRP